MSILKRSIYKIKKKFVPANFTDSTTYWIDRYRSGGNSGAGSYDDLASFKAKVINTFIKNNSIKSVVEFGCGDGNQLSLFIIEKYIGYDVSPDAVELCRRKFKDDSTKEFFLLNQFTDLQVDLTLSLDVLYHLTEDNIYEDYMDRLFASSLNHVIIYSSNTEQSEKEVPHVRARKFTDWIEENRPDFELLQHIPNEHPFNEITGAGSKADFFIYGRKLV